MSVAKNSISLVTGDGESLQTIAEDVTVCFDNGETREGKQKLTRNIRFYSRETSDMTEFKFCLNAVPFGQKKGSWRSENVRVLLSVFMSNVSTSTVWVVVKGEDVEP
ncbi:hypothetical protein RUM44_010192 [Polyplax serrata]|uniref:LAGLIDADG homing endonuclease n=1 Tax=Polyplax serrata TaxID=468196 RepID=A0ABR1AWC0_POLSC